MTETLGFIGLGVMGSGMCANVVKKHKGPVVAFDPVAAAVAEQVANGAVAAHSVAEIALISNVIFLSLPGGKQVAEVCEIVSEFADPDTVVVDMSTTGATEARAVAASLADNGLLFADAPVARTRQAAIDGTLAITVGADPALFAQIEPLLRYMGTDVSLCGPVGCGQVVKLINNTLVFEQVAALAEMFVVGERAGVPRAVLADVISRSSGDSFALRNQGMKAMVPNEFPPKSFPAAYVLKDLGYSMELAREMGVEPRLTELASEYFRRVDAAYGDLYYPALVDLIDKESPR